MTWIQIQCTNLFFVLLWGNTNNKNSKLKCGVQQTIIIKLKWNNKLQSKNEIIIIENNNKLCIGISMHKIMKNNKKKEQVYV